MLVRDRIALERRKQGILKSEEEYRFYTELKRRTDASVINEEERNSGFTIGDYTVTFENGEIILQNKEKVVEKYAIADFSRKPNAVFRRLMRNITVSL